MKLKTLIGAVATSALLGPLSASAFQVFMQDFEAGIGGAETIGVDVGESVSGIDTRAINCGASCPFSVQSPGENGPVTRNWNVHHQNTNPYAGGNGSSGNPMKHNPNMDGQVFGHVYANYDHHEDNFYEISNIDLANDWTDISLMFDFDSWISSDVDGFAVSFSTNGGSSWVLLNPTSSYDMQYRNLGNSDQSLNSLARFNKVTNSSKG